MKYIPSVISGIAALGSFIKANFFSSGFGDIGYMILALVAAAVFIASILTAVVVEFMKSRK